MRGFMQAIDTHRCMCACHHLRHVSECWRVHITQSLHTTCRASSGGRWPLAPQCGQQQRAPAAGLHRWLRQSTRQPNCCVSIDIAQRAYTRMALGPTTLHQRHIRIILIILLAIVCQCKLGRDFSPSWKRALLTTCALSALPLGAAHREWLETLLCAPTAQRICTPLLHSGASAALIPAMRIGVLHNTADAARALKVHTRLVQGSAAEIIHRALHGSRAREKCVAVKICCQHVPIGQEDSPTRVLIVATSLA